MKEVKAIIQPFKLDDVLEALRAIENLPAVTVSAVQGYNVAHPEYQLHTKIKLEVMVPDDLVQAVVDAIGRAARTGNPGDGRVFVIDIEQTVKVSTGQPDTAH